MKSLIFFVFLSTAFAEVKTTESEKKALKTEKMEVVETAEMKPEKNSTLEKASEEPELKEEIKVTGKVVETGLEKDSKSEKASEEKKLKEKEMLVEKPVSKDKLSEVEKTSEIKPAPTVKTGAETSTPSGVKYVCDENKFYILYEPGNESSHLCELDAGHTDQPADWYALNDSSFCRGKMEELISQYQCVKETK